MPSKKKAAIKGPFFFYMLDFRKRAAARGKTFPGGMEQLMIEAGPHWNMLTDAERAVYKVRAQGYKSTTRETDDVCDSFGIPVSQFRLETKIRLTKEEKIRLAIVEMLETGCCNNALEKVTVHFISFNIFCKAHSGNFVPAEMGIIRYSLESGILDQLHLLIDPERLPLGMAHEANLLSLETHRIPIPPNSFGEKDYARIFDKVISFIDRDSRPLYKSPLITEGTEVEMVDNILEQLAISTSEEHSLTVCSLGDFFFHLKRTTERYGLDICTFPSKQVADIILKKDMYEYTSGIGCEYHENIGNSQYCALSKATRWSYIISDSCCLDLSIDLVPGRHLPLNARASLHPAMAELNAKRKPGEGDGQDKMSFVSSSELTHLSMPKIYQFRDFEKEESETESSSTRVASEELVSVKSDSDTKDSLSYSLLLPRSSLASSSQNTSSCTVTTSKGSSTSVAFPFIRKMKQEARADPRHMVGHGRGSLLGARIFQQTTSSLVKGFGRGSSLASSICGGSTTATSSVGRVSDDESE